MSSDDGILLYSGEILSWRAFESLITIINAKLNKQLILCLGLCNGHHFLTRISPFRDVPMNYLVSTEEEISFDELYRGFEAFYESYFSQYRVEQAIEAFNSEIGHDRMCYITAKDYMDMLMTPEIEPEGFRRMVNSAAVLYKASYPEYMDLPFSEVLVIAEYNIRTTFAYYKQLNSIS
ncbi:MAG: hypothetical protein M0D57_04570 [Sphingobacteriales bacterium JAD_PAG50586_3]|nr:MAG: hypothetical protein M0D57_04570 [Sphingobacteriales bacterium JAD_PAG50586_3]